MAHTRAGNMRQIVFLAALCLLLPISSAFGLGGDDAREAILIRGNEKDALLNNTMEQLVKGKFDLYSRENPAERVKRVKAEMVERRGLREKNPSAAPAGAADSSAVGVKIVGGDDVAHQGRFPFQVGLQDGNTNYSPWCGGTLLGLRSQTPRRSNWVLTAAHCIGSTTGTLSPSHVFAWRSNLSDTTELNDSRAGIHAISRIIVHPKYNSQTMEHDVALLQLDGDGIVIKYNTYLATEQEYYNSTPMWATGWGALYSGGPQPDVMQKVKVPLMTDRECKKAYENGYTEFKKNKMICAGYPEGGKDACQGDSGGPLWQPLPIAQYGRNSLILHGVTSWGIGCAEAAYPGVYAGVKRYKRWVEFHTGLSLDPPNN